MCQLSHLWWRKDTSDGILSCTLGERTPNKKHHTKLTLEKKISPTASARIWICNFHTVSNIWQYLLECEILQNWKWYVLDIEYECRKIAAASISIFSPHDGQELGWWDIAAVSKTLPMLFISSKWYCILCSGQLKLAPHTWDHLCLHFFYLWGEFWEVHLTCRSAS